MYEFGYFVHIMAALAWTLFVWCVARFVGQNDAYKAGMSAGFAAGVDAATYEDEDDLPVTPETFETFEEIAGLRSAGPARSTCILPPALEEDK